MPREIISTVPVGGDIVIVQRLPHVSLDSRGTPAWRSGRSVIPTCPALFHDIITGMNNESLLYSILQNYHRRTNLTTTV